MQLDFPRMTFTTMRKLKQICVALMTIASVVGVISAENPKMATVDMQRLFKDYDRTNAVQNRFNMEYAVIQKGVNERIEEVTRMRLMLEKLQAEIDSDTLTDVEKSKKEQELMLIDHERKMMGDKIKMFEEQEREKVKRLMAASMQGIMREIRGRVVDHAEQEGYDYVFDKSGKSSNQVAYFIYLKDAKDITATMIEKLNKFVSNTDGK